MAFDLPAELFAVELFADEFFAAAPPLDFAAGSAVLLDAAALPPVLPADLAVAVFAAAPLVADFAVAVVLLELAVEDFPVEAFAAVVPTDFPVADFPAFPPDLPGVPVDLLAVDLAAGFEAVLLVVDLAAVDLLAVVEAALVGAAFLAVDAAALDGAALVVEAALVGAAFFAAAGFAVGFFVAINFLLLILFCKFGNDWQHPVASIKMPMLSGRYDKLLRYKNKCVKIFFRQKHNILLSEISQTQKICLNCRRKLSGESLKL